MKYLYFSFIALVLSGCMFRNKVTVSGSVTGIRNVTISMKDGSGQVLAAANVKDGKYTLESTGWSNPDYGTLTFSRPGQDDVNTEIYFEPGAYVVNYDYGDINNPKVTSGSATQNQLSAFSQIFEQLSVNTKRKVTALDIKYKQAVRGPKMWGDSLSHLAEQTEAEHAKLEDVGRIALNTFLTKFPDNLIGLHCFQTLSYESNPTAYYAVFKKLPANQQNSDDGKMIGSRLNALIHLVPGQPAPQIVGVMPDGKPFNLKSLHRKLILIEFWRAANYPSRVNHQTMIKTPWPAFTNNQMGIVSVSFDKKRDWWLGSMRDDKLTWPQVSDLKGVDSPNWASWAIDHMPTYYLLDDKGHILENNLEFKEIPLAVDKYLKTAKL